MWLESQVSGSGPAIVLLHGFPLDRTMWERQISEFAEDFRVITLDLRGHGASPAPDGTYTMDQMADDVLETLDSLGLTEPFVVGGLSMGGYVAMSIAARHPERLKGLMLINTRAKADTPETARIREELAQIVLREGKVDAVVGTMAPRLVSPSTLVNHPELMTRLQEQMNAISPTGVVNTLRGLAIRPDRTEALARFRKPTLMIAGADDLLIPITESNEMAAVIPDANLVVIPHAGHLAPLENPEATNTAIRHFLASLG
jgi:pimeloyl-ACP methyl ester carboxylesterase